MRVKLNSDKTVSIDGWKHHNVATARRAILNRATTEEIVLDPESVMDQDLIRSVFNVS